MTIVLINPNLLVQKNDPFTTGIVYMPIGLASIAGNLRKSGEKLLVIDAFGENPFQKSLTEKFMILGLSIKEILLKIPSDVECFFIYANQIINHKSVIAIAAEIKKVYPNIPVIALENTQAVTAYDLRAVSSELLDSGFDFVLTGEAELRVLSVLAALRGEGSVNDCDGLYGDSFMNPAKSVIENLDDLPFPAWDLFPVKNYWNLRFAHGPQSENKYLPILTSRGCPYPCKFCVVPATNFLKWRARSPQNVVNEMNYFNKLLGVKEFHWEDLDSTVNDKRTLEICRILIEENSKFKWKIVAGTKVETMKSENTIVQMAKAGCSYISISPESGSPKVLKLMAKPFRVNHAVKLIKQMNKVGIKSQACFVLGFPGEDDNDRYLTKKLIKSLTIEGLDEVAIFIISPVPGSAIFKEFNGYEGLSDLNFTPTWREDYEVLNKLRISLYRKFLIWKIIHHPVKVLLQCINFALRRFETKMEMVPYKAIVWKVTEMKR